MNIKKELNIIYLSAGIFFIVLAFSAVFPLLSAIEKSYSDNVKLKNDLVSYQYQEKKYAELTGQYSGINTTFDNLFIDREAPIEIIEFWEKIASDAGVTIQISANDSLGSNADGWQYMSFKIITAGSFSGVSRFLEKIELEPYLGQISRVSMEKNVANNNTKNKLQEKGILGEIISTISIIVYVKP